MKKYLYLSCFALTPYASYAQPTIYNMENNPIGMVATYLQCDTASTISSGLNGANVTWNMTGLVKLHNASINDTFYEYTVANPPGSPSSTATRMDSFVNSYASPTGNMYVNQTTGASYLLNWTLFPGTYFDYITPTSGHLIAKQPIHYLDTLRDTFVANFYSSTPMIPFHGSNTTIVDGWGTLNLPGGVSYSNVLRVHISERDTSMGTVINPTNTDSYVWYDDHHSVPLCKLDVKSSSFNVARTYYYLLSQTPLVKVEILTKATTDFTACFAGSKLFLNCDFGQGQSYSMSVFNLAGQRIYSSTFEPNGSNASFNIDTWLTPGIYSVLLTNNSTHAFSAIKVLR